MKNYRGFYCLREEDKNLNKQEDLEKLPPCSRYNVCYIKPFHKRHIY